MTTWYIYHGHRQPNGCSRLFISKFATGDVQCTGNSQSVGKYIVYIVTMSSTIS